MRLKFLFLLILAALTFPPRTEAQTSGYIKSASVSHYFGTSTTVPTEAEVSTKSSELALQLKNKMGSEPVKVIVVITNSGFPAQTVTSIKNVFGSNVLVAGVATGAAKYEPLSIDFFPPPESKELVITAIGGTAISSVTQTEGSYGNGGNPTIIHDGALVMANSLTPNPLKKNLLLLLGPAHWDHNVTILNAVKESNWAKPSWPSYVKAIGVGSADGFAASIVNGSVKGGTITALLISGDFNVASRGVGEGFGGDPAAVSKNLLNQIKTELGGNADLLFYVPGHPDTETGYTGIPKEVMFANMRQSVIDVFGSVPLIGHVGSSETGQKTTDGNAEAVKYTFYATGIKAGNIPASSITPTPTMALKQGDANGDGKVDIKDYVFWVKNFSKSLSGPSNGDFNSNGKVDGLDYIIWLKNFVI